MAVINPVGYLHNLATHTAQIDRLSGGAGLLVPDTATSLRPRGGVRMRGDCTVSAQATPNMTARVSAGLCYVPQGQSSLGSAYAVPNDGSFNVTVPAAHATLVRRDLVVVRVRDSFYTGASNVGSIELISGTAASTPVDPTLPTDSSFYVLARIIVPAAATTITNAMITNLATPIQLINGITPVNDGDTVTGLYVGQTRDHPLYGVQRWDGAQWWRIGGPEIALTPYNSDVEQVCNAGTDTTFATATWTVPTAGVLEVTAAWNYATAGTAACYWRLMLNGVLARPQIRLHNGGAAAGGARFPMGFTARIPISAPGSHTVQMRCLPDPASATMYINNRYLTGYM